ncbi:hypothetical protein P8C59_003619 [Phyllachora maydis]|uniref:ditrans,polycis-polyprenyl diphosphate synthase [(2E,6E)-farnesyldiphosphate specific] n=1 Tax=Phyllachora maydis TaxID=1825666 RepID=A0AAD9I1S7_9PEZI|nr:hypothetical protein P8C59_003619 [Phyllachora maydis]
MAYSRKATLAYRRDEKFGHKLLTPEERVRLATPFLPAPRKGAASAKVESTSRLGVRRFLKHQLHLLVFTLTHAVFSLYMRIRIAYHAVVYRVCSVLFYHHKTPELIERDVKGLRRLPRHLSVILSLDEDKKGGDELEQLVNEVADIAAWCTSAGIPQLSIYEKTGILKGYLPQVHRAISRKLAQYFGSSSSALTVRAPHMPSIDSPPSIRTSRLPDNSGPRHLSVVMLSSEDGRDSIVDLTKTLAEMTQRDKIAPSDITIDLVDAELSESVVNDPDLLILFGPHVELDGYPPWQVRLTEIYHLTDNHGVEYHVFYRALCHFARAQMRFGR